MVTPTKNKTLPKKLIPIQNLYYDQVDGTTQDSDSMNELQYKVVNKVYDMQFWHYHYSHPSANDRLKMFTKWFGPANTSKKNARHGLMHIWTIIVNDSKYVLYLTNITFFMETPKDTPFENVLADLKEIEKLLLSDKPKKDK